MIMPRVYIEYTSYQIAWVNENGEDRYFGCGGGGGGRGGGGLIQPKCTEYTAYRLYRVPTRQQHTSKGSIHAVKIDLYDNNDNYSPCLLCLYCPTLTKGSKSHITQI